LATGRPLKPAPNLDCVAKPGATDREPLPSEHPSTAEGKMSFETVSLLLSWLEMGTLLAILFRLGRTFELIASTQRELRRAIHHLGERRAFELGTNYTLGAPGIASASSSPRAPAAAESAISRDDLQRSRPPSTIDTCCPSLR
jgi:hypothetical protein